MEISDLTFFLAVVRAKGITRASEDLHTVQSNVSARIRSLENEVGVALFRRHARGVALTSAGEKFLPYAERVVQLIDEGVQLLGDIEDPAGRLAVGAMETTAGWRLPSILALFTDDCPRVDIFLETGPTDVLVQAVLDRKLDCAFVSGPVEHIELLEKTVFVEELVFVSSLRNSHLDQLVSVSSVERILVFRSGCSYRAKLLSLLNSNGITNPTILEFGTLEGILGCVAAGMGVTLLPRGVVEASALANQVLIQDLPPDLARVETSFVRRADTMTSPAMTRFIAQLGDHRTTDLNTHMDHTSAGT